MKTRNKIIITVIAVVAILTGIYLFSGNNGDAVIIKSDGEIIRVIDLESVSEPYSFDVEYGGYNKIYVEKGKISVTEADCPDKLCIKQSKAGLFPVVCLPHKLIIERE